MASARDDAAERARLNVSIPLLPASEDDAAAARQQAFGVRALGEDARCVGARAPKRLRDVHI